MADNVEDVDWYIQYPTSAQLTVAYLVNVATNTTWQPYEDRVPPCIHP